MLRSVFRACLIAYPSDFRENYRQQIESDFDVELEEHTSSAERTAFALRSVCDLLMQGAFMRLERLYSDVSYAFRRLLHAPLFAVVVLLTFALGIGANIAVFSVLHGVLLSPLPYPNQARLVSLNAINLRKGAWTDAGAFSLPDVADIASSSKTLESVAPYSPASGTYLGGAKPLSLLGYSVGWQIFDTFGVKPLLGRFFTAQDARNNSAAVVLSERFWRTYLGADPGAVGKLVNIDGKRVPVIGIAPAAAPMPNTPPANGLNVADFWRVAPVQFPRPSMRGERYWGAIGLLKPGTSIERARADIKRIAARLRSAYPSFDRNIDFTAIPMQQLVIGDMDRLLWIAFAAVIGVLLITCANVGNLLLTSLVSRDRELSVRIALGAGYGRVVRQLFVETGVLAAMGGVLGIFVALGALKLFRSVAPASFPRLSDVHLDLATFLYCAGVVVAVTLIAGLWPVLALRRADIATALKSAGRGGDGTAGKRVRAALAIAEIAIALVLVVASGLLVRSFFQLSHANLGVRTDGLLVSDDAFLAQNRYPNDASRHAYLRQLLSNLQRIPGLDAVALATTYPLSDDQVGFSVGIRGKSYGQTDMPNTSFNTISPGYLQAMGVPLLRGRNISANDTENSARVALVNREFERRYLPGGAVGKVVQFPIFSKPGRLDWTIVGVTGNERYSPTSSVQPEIYAPIQQTTAFWVQAVAHTARPGTGDANAIAQAFLASDRLQAPPRIMTMSQRLRGAAGQTNAIAWMLSALALIALILAATGTFAVVSFTVSQRTPEFGIRRALGATPRTILAGVLSDASRFAALGIVLGIIICAIVTAAMTDQLYGVSPHDPLTYGVVVAILVATVLLAAFIPGVRASAIQPATALHYE
jgi:putative ABC transport system permease protein